ncbi:MAG: SPFH domain-containing protein [Acholeplasmataceae bacterium]|nr:SPFH domain-containing protein [Acholeplasmataceae bacterium]
MFETIYPASIVIFALLLLYLLSRFKLIPQSKTGLIERYGMYYKPISPGIHFLVPFVDKMVVFDVKKVLNLNREIVEIQGEPRASLSLQVSYKVIDEKDYHEKNVDQFMRSLLIDVAREYIENYGTSGISQQKIALTTRFKGAILNKVVDWGIELSEIDLLMAMEIPSQQ